MNTKERNLPHPAAPAAHHPQDRLWVLILSVDCADQWPEDRCRVGDLALARAFHLLTTTAACTTSNSSSSSKATTRSKITTTSNTTTTSSSSRVTLCTDATVEQAQSTLRTVLRDMHDHDDDDNDDQLLPRTLVVYYGGHGASNGFCMAATSSSSSNQNEEANEDERSNTSHKSSHDPIWQHDSILAILFNDDNSSSYHTWRPQDQVWFLVDCCYSGNFLQQWQHRCESSMTKSTIILPHSCIVASTAPDTTAGGDWTLTETWLGAMRMMAEYGAAATCGEQRRHQPYNDQPTTESVSHPNGDHSGQVGTSTTVRHVLNAMQLEILRVKKNKMCYYIFNSGANEGSVRLEDPFPFRLPCFSNPTANLAVGRFPPSPVQRLQCQLAEQGLFRSYQHCPGSMFWAIWGEDDQLYQGEVMSDEALLGHCGDYDCLSDGNGTLGPYIPVHWVEEGTNSVIPLGHCFFHSMSTTCSDSGATIPNIVSWICHCFFPVRKNRNTTDHYNDTDSEMATTVEELRSRAQQSARDEMQRFAVAWKSDEPRMLLWDYRIEALRRSMESAGKYLRMPTEFVTTQNLGTRPTHGALECWDDHAKSWLRGSLVELHNATVHIVATHLEHSEQGDYFVVATEAYQTCLPSALLRAALD